MENKIKEISKIVFLILTVFVFIIIIIEIIRNTSYQQLDDVHPTIFCDEKYIEKSDVLMIIPLFNNDSIANYPEWCKIILEYNKTLGMHGIYHTYNEFLGGVSEDSIVLAIKEFEKCFGKKPEFFEPPQWEISSQNKMLVKKYMKITNPLQGVIHKVYHCGNGTASSYNFHGTTITNGLIDVI